MNYADFIAHCVEIYRQSENLSGYDVIELFNKHNIIDYIEGDYEGLHIEGPDAIVWQLKNHMSV